MRAYPLPGYPVVVDDLSAINAALAFGVTSNPLRNSGLGLFMTQLLLKLNGGTLLVRSGTAAVERGATDREWTDLPRIKGTLVALRARIDRPLSLKPVYEALEDARVSGQGPTQSAAAGQPCPPEPQWPAPRGPDSRTTADTPKTTCEWKWSRMPNTLGR